MTFVCGFPAHKLLVNPARRVSQDNRIFFKLFSHASDICSFHSKMSEEFLPKPACRKNYWPSEILKIIQKELFPLSHPHRLIDNLQLDTMSQTLIQNSRQRKKESDWKFHSLTFPPPYATAGHRKLKCWTAYGLIMKVQKAFLCRSCIYAGKNSVTKFQQVFPSNSLSLSLITVFTVTTVYLHPEFWWSRGWGVGVSVFESVCVALEAPVEAPWGPESKGFTAWARAVQCLMFSTFSRRSELVMASGVVVVVGGVGWGQPTEMKGSLRAIKRRLLTSWAQILAR